MKDVFANFDTKLEQADTSFDGTWIKWDDVKGVRFVGTLKRIWVRKDPKSEQENTAFFVSNAQSCEPRGKRREYTEDIGFSAVSTIKSKFDDGTVREGDEVGFCFVGARKGGSGMMYKDVRIFRISEEPRSEQVKIEDEPVPF